MWDSTSVLGLRSSLFLFERHIDHRKAATEALHTKTAAHPAVPGKLSSLHWRKFLAESLAGSLPI